MAEDKRRFVLVTQVDDPLTLDAYLRVLQAAGIPTLSLDDEGMVGSITDGFTGKLYDIRVPEESLERAAQLLTEEKARLEATADEAARAAEDEEAETEKR